MNSFNFMSTTSSFFKFGTARITGHDAMNNYIAMQWTVQFYGFKFGTVRITGHDEQF